MSTENQALRSWLKPVHIWALALGTSIGWGSLVVTSNTYLSQAGPAGSALGLIVGAVIMLVICRNYVYMINCFPDAGGAYAYTKETFGYDYGFLVSWFLCLTYLAMFWANAMSMPLFARYFIGNLFHFGRLYALFGYDVYLGEALLSIAVIALAALLCAKRQRAAMGLMVGLVVLFAVGITACFVAAMLRRDTSMAPAFLPDTGSLRQVINIACISPWAFIGFENISHTTEEFAFQRSKVRRVLVSAVLVTTALYLFVLLLSVSAYPTQYNSWLEYIRDLNNLEGLEGLPAFYAADHYLGGAGVTLLILSLLALIVTSLIGNAMALSRVIYAMARDNVLPERLGRLNKRQAPERAVLLIALVSLPIPFLGRTAIGWIVDVTTLGATLIYGFISGATIKIATQRSDTRDLWSGRVGVACMAAIGLYLLVPNFFSTGSMSKETYFLFVVWSVLGFLFFRYILRRDQGKRFGKSLIVWLALLALVLLVALIWMNQSMMEASDETMSRIHAHYFSSETLTEMQLADESYIEHEIGRLRRTNAETILVVAGLFAFAVVVMFTNYSYMNRKQQESELALGHARDILNTDPLTGVKSKHAFTMREKELDEHIGSGEAEPFAVVVCDVNGLKYVNDTQGHKAGDEYIKSAARLICELFDHSPVFRTGGDEFVVIMTGRDYERRQEILRELDRRSEENIQLDQVVVSAGLSDYRKGEDEKFHQIFGRADDRMYARKQALKNMGARTRS